MHILIVEDEAKLAWSIAAGMSGSGHDAEIAPSAELGLEHLRSDGFDLLLVDLMLPRLSGLEFVREVRRRGDRTPILILTSKGTVDDRVRGLDAGADDYMVKPFAFAELMARAKALHRRMKPESPSNLQLADLRMDVAGHRVERRGIFLELTNREFEVLQYLLENQGAVVSRDMLAREVWKDPMRFTPLDNVIDVHIARIRKKIDDPFAVKLLKTVRGVGFVLREED